MSDDLPDDPKFRMTMDRLKAVRHESESGSEYWRAREIQPILGYDEWRNFGGVVARARAAMEAAGVAPSHHIVGTNKMMRLGQGTQRSVDDLFLSRAACYLIAMNGDPSKPEIAAAQVYFAVQTRAREIEQAQSEDEKRLEQRDKVRESFKQVSSVAQSAGVPGPRQALFHSARYEGLYKKTSREYKEHRGLGERENPLDRMGVLELSANDFQMNLAAETIEKEGVRGEAAAIRKNKEIAQRVRKTMIDSGSVPPENLPIAEPIKNVEKRVKQERKAKSLPSSGS